MVCSGFHKNLDDFCRNQLSESFSGLVWQIEKQLQQVEVKESNRFLGGQCPEAISSYIAAYISNNRAMISLWEFNECSIRKMFWKVGWRLVKLFIEKSGLFLPDRTIKQFLMSLYMPNKERFIPRAAIGNFFTTYSSITKQCKDSHLVKYYKDHLWSKYMYHWKISLHCFNWENSHYLTNLGKLCLLNVRNGADYWHPSFWELRALKLFQCNE